MKKNLKKNKKTEGPWVKRSWPIQRQMKVLYHESWKVRSAFSAEPTLGWGELWGDGRKRGRAEAGWVTWAFVGRWWEAPPWPIALNAKQRCHCLTSAATDTCAACFSGNQKQNNRPPPSTAHIHASPPCFSSTAAHIRTPQKLTPAYYRRIPIQQQPRPDGAQHSPTLLTSDVYREWEVRQWRHSGCRFS